MCTNTQKNKMYKALAHSTRREIIRLLRASPGLSNGQLATNFDISRVAVLGHIRVLESAGIIDFQQKGRIRQWCYNHVAVQSVHAQWVEEYTAGLETSGQVSP